MSRQAEEQCQEKLNSAIECLVSCLRSRDGSIREMIRKCLVSIGQLAIPALIQALDSNNRDTRWEATKALGEIGNPCVAEALVGILSRDQFAIRWLAAEGLISIGKQGLEPLLLALLHDPDSGFLRDGTHHVLNAVRDADASLWGILTPLIDALDTLRGTGDIIPHIETILETVRGEDEEAQTIQCNEVVGES